jgi:hypothetical protein
MLKLLGLVAIVIVGLIIFTGHGDDALSLISQSKDDAAVKIDSATKQINEVSKNAAALQKATSGRN